MPKLAQWEWRLPRIALIEDSLFSGDLSSVAGLFRHDSVEQALVRLGRYETRIRRNWYRALGEFRALRRDEVRVESAEARYRQAEANARFRRLLDDVDHRATSRMAETAGAGR